MIIYLAGPIDGITAQEARDWREHMQHQGVLFFNPATAWVGASTFNAGELDFGNRSALVACDGLLANLTGPGMGFGTVREIEFARQLGLPVAVAGQLGHSLMTYDLIVHDTVAVALTALVAEIVKRAEEI